MPVTDGGVGSASNVVSTKSAVMVFGPRRRLPDFDLHLGGVSLPVVSSYKYLCVLLTPTLCWTKHVQFLIGRGNLPVQMASSIFRVHVLPRLLGSEFFLHLLDGAIRRWGRHVLGWPPGSPCAGALCELGWPDAEHLAMGRLLSLLGRSFSMARVLDAHSPPLSSVWRLNRQGRGPTMHLPCVPILTSLLSLQLVASSSVRRWVDLVIWPSTSGCKPQSTVSPRPVFPMVSRSLSMLALMSSCMAEEVLRNMRGSGASPVGS